MNLKLLILILLVSVIPSKFAHADITGVEGFESSERALNFKGSISDHFGLWIDGGSGASTKDKVTFTYTTILDNFGAAKNYVGWGEKAMALAGVSSSDSLTKSSIYTKVIDYSASESVEVSFSVLPINKKGITFVYDFSNLQMLRLEVSHDGGNNFSTVKSWDVSNNYLYFGSAYDLICKPVIEASDVTGPFGEKIAEAICLYGTQAIIDEFYEELSFTITDRTLLSQTTVIRLKADFPNESLDLYVDELELTSKVGELNTKSPKNTYSSKTPFKSFDRESFDVEENAAWGIWQDGGSDAYQSSSYVSPSVDELAHLQELTADGGIAKSDIEDLYDTYVAGGKSVAIREFYDPDWLEDPDNEFSGEKPDYSSIVTENLDLTDYKQLELHFSFVAIDLRYMDVYPYYDGGYEGDNFTVSISRDAGITWTNVKTYTAGDDFLNNVRYSDVSLLIKNSDFTDLAGKSNDFDGFTTTTKIRIQADTSSESKIIYLDNVEIFTAGDSGIDFGSETKPNWEKLDYSKLNSTGVGNTYDSINQVLHTGSPELEVRLDLLGQYGAVEHSDCSHDESTINGITEGYDSSLGKSVFRFTMNKALDTDRCKNTDEDAVFDQVIAETETEYHPYLNSSIMGGSGEVPDRQRVEIKTLDNSEEFQKAELGETHFYAWKFKLPDDFATSDMFTHLHQIKSRDATELEEGKPLITLTAGAEKTDDDGNITTVAQMRLRYSPESQSQINLAVADLSPFLGNWVQAVEKITVGEAGLDGGRYEIRLSKIKNNGKIGDELMYFKSNTLRMTKTDASFMRAKWGIYRSLIEQDRLKDEEILFSDVIILEANDSRASLDDFTLALEDLEDTPTTASTSFQPDEDKTYFIDSSNGRRLMSNGEEEGVWSSKVSKGKEGDNTQWQFVSAGNGYWNIQLANGGKWSRLRSDGSSYADMATLNTNGTKTYFQMEARDTKSGEYYITLPDGPEDYSRLGLNSRGDVLMNSPSKTSVAYRFTITPAD